MKIDSTMVLNTELRIIEATPALLAQFYDGKQPPFTLRGHVAMRGDQVIGVGGIHYLGGVAVAFTDFKDMSRKDRARCFRFMEQRLATWRGQLIAICTADNSRRLLRRLGFEDVGNDTMVRTWHP